MKKVNYSQTIAIDISGPLKIKAKDISKYLIISIGDRIEEESVLARKKSFLGVDKIEIRSPVEGIVDNIDTDKGVILVTIEEEGMEEETIDNKLETRNEKQEEDLKENIDDEIEIKINQRAENGESRVKINSSVKTKGLDGFGDGEGIGMYVEEFGSNNLNSEMRDKIIICENLPEIKVFYKASAIGIEGIICNTRNESEIEKLKNELENKTHLGFLVLSNEIDLKSLHNRKIKIDNGVLEIE